MRTHGRRAIVTAISLKLPDELVDASTRAARDLGITRAEFVRQALRHELARLGRQQEHAAMAESLRAMKTDAAWLEDAETLDRGVDDTLPPEEDRWWIQTSS